MWWLLVLGCPHAPGEGAVSASTATPNEQQYAACLVRVEGREKEQECGADADCVAAGCSSEVCLSASSAEGFMSTCDKLDCFSVLDRCGCNSGRCTWTLKPG